jgi:hypothetical protein
MTSEKPKRIWIDYKKANDGFLAYDEAPNTPFSECRDEYLRADLTYTAADLDRAVAAALEAAEDAAFDADSLELAMHGEAKIMERIRAIDRAAIVRSVTGKTESEE